MTTEFKRRSLCKRTFYFLAGMTIAAPFLWSSFKGSGKSIDPNFVPQLRIEGGMEVRNPRFYLSSEKGFSLVVAADRAHETVDQTGLLALDKPVARFTNLEGKKGVVEANKGYLEQDKKYVKLQGDILLKHSDGFVIRTSAVEIDIEARAILGLEPVEGEGPQGVFKAQGVRILENGNRVILFGGSELTARDE